MTRVCESFNMQETTLSAQPVDSSPDREVRGLAGAAILRRLHAGSWRAPRPLRFCA
jgi:hypothetical protein